MENEKKNKIKLGFIIIGIFFIILGVVNLFGGKFTLELILGAIFLYLGFRSGRKRSKKEIQTYNTFIRIVGSLFGISLIIGGLYSLPVLYPIITNVEETPLIMRIFFVFVLIFLFGFGGYLIYTAIKMGIKKTSKKSK
jgi:hypothetical protein